MEKKRKDNQDNQENQENQDNQENKKMMKNNNLKIKNLKKERYINFYKEKTI